MLYSVSNSMPRVAFGEGQTNALSKLTPEMINSPGQFTVQPEASQTPAEQKKKGGFLSGLTKAVVATIVVLGGAVAARKLAMKGYEVADAVPEGFMEKAKHYFAKYSDAIYDNTVAKVVNLFSKSKAE